MGKHRGGGRLSLSFFCQNAWQMRTDVPGDVRLPRPFHFRKFLVRASPILPCSGCASLSRGFLLSPAGPIAQAEHHEFIVVGIVLLFVLAPVLLLVPLIAWHYRISNTHAAFRPQWGFSWILELLIWVPPTGIVVLLAVFLVGYTTRLDPYRPLPSDGSAALQIDVVALDWKWLFLYPAQHVATVNQLVLPVGQPVHFSLTSGTVMQSLFMPRLAGQIYAMAGMTTQLNFEISKPGIYSGENTQYNGDGFPEDKFSIQAVPAAEFTKWAAQAQGNPAALGRSRLSDALPPVGTRSAAAIRAFRTRFVQAYPRSADPSRLSRTAS